eukprot:scaffold2520_cov324-Prasinococcus_capsulatus_cf.AAC.2
MTRLLAARACRCGVRRRPIFHSYRVVNKTWALHAAVDENRAAFDERTLAFYDALLAKGECATTVANPQQERAVEGVDAHACCAGDGVHGHGRLYLVRGDAPHIHGPGSPRPYSGEGAYKITRRRCRSSAAPAALRYRHQSQDARARARASIVVLRFPPRQGRAGRLGTHASSGCGRGCRRGPARPPAGWSTRCTAGRSAAAAARPTKLRAAHAAQRPATRDSVGTGGGHLIVHGSHRLARAVAFSTVMLGGMWSPTTGPRFRPQWWHPDAKERPRTQPPSPTPVVSRGPIASEARQAAGRGKVCAGAWGAPYWRSMRSSVARCAGVA